MRALKRFLPRCRAKLQLSSKLLVWIATSVSSSLGSLVSSSLSLIVIRDPGFGRPEEEEVLVAVVAVVVVVVVLAAAAAAVAAAAVAAVVV
jgi:hypothetical protein